MILSKEVYGLGFALSCDFLKELGYINFGKPDVHIHKILKGLGLVDKKADDYEVLKAIDRIARNVGVSSYNVDKLLWLIGSGYFYDDKDLGNEGRIKQINRDEFIRISKPLLI
jgi:thermostable 8-oxoguanine DNA glycosylase